MRRILAGAGLSTLEILDQGSFYWIALSGGEIVGTCGLEVDGHNGLVRSIAVNAAARGRGVARTLLATLVDFARSRGLDHLYCFSKDTGQYFISLGWQSAPVDVAANALRNAPQVIRYTNVGWYPDEKAFAIKL